MASSIELLVCDLDNTLYDWVSYFVPSFYAMIDVAVQITGIDREQLLDDMRVVHQRHQDSEQPYALLEAKAVQERYAGLSLPEVAKALDPAFHAFNSARKRNLKLHDGVIETLGWLQARGIILVAHTEAKLHGALGRLRRLGLLPYFRRIYCREGSETLRPDLTTSGKWFSDLSLENVRELLHHQSKPNPRVLLEICADEGIHARDSAYVGDSMARDMLMAKRAEVFAIWAAYGVQHDRKLYDNLVRITHWTENEVATEIRLRSEAASIKPDYIARSSFREVIKALEVARESVVTT
jgi:phosphoglycolate phosphatase